MIYTYARLGRGDLGFYRLFGEGLGNVLFPWARSMIAARKEGALEIWPAWKQVFHRGGWRDVWKERQGSYGLKNLRNYDAIFQPTGAQITGMRKLAALLSSRRIAEDEYRPGTGDSLPGRSVIVFEGLGQQFADLAGEHEFLRAELWARTAPEIRERVLARPELRQAICLHIRLGDFPNHGLEAVFQLSHNSRLPQAWYVEKIRQLRAVLGEDRRVLIFSDGKDDELAEVLSLPNSERISLGSALADLWAMASAGVLICSLSTMNNWACYLGRPPAVRLCRVMRHKLYDESPETEVESGIGDLIPDSFMEAVLQRSAHQDKI